MPKKSSANMRFAKAYVAKRGKLLPAGGRNMKKTTKKGAYNKNRKRIFQRRRAPFVETKTKSAEDLVIQFGMPDDNKYNVSNTMHRHLNPNTFLMHMPGIGENEVIGQSIYARYLKMKISVQFPHPSVLINGTTPQKIPFSPQRYELVWGWIPAPTNYTTATNPVVTQATIGDLNQYINLKVVEYFNERKDKLRFIPKKAATIRIIGRRKVRPDNRYQASAPAQSIEGGAISADYAIGCFPKYNTSISWPLNRKVHLEKSESLHPVTAGGNGAGGLYPNYSWLPFATFIAWDYDSLPNNSPGEREQFLPTIAHNDQLWYSDS